jgi:hypothetical protein
MCEIKMSEINGITSSTAYESGETKECRVDAYNLIRTKYGDFVPQYKDLGIRKKELKSLAFYKSGNVRSISLEQQTNVETSIGVFPAELVTFFEDGSLNSLFPLNGQIGFSWSEKEEGELSKIFAFNFPFGQFSAKIIGLRFYQNGNLRSLVLWPKELITIQTPLGEMKVRVGFTLYEDGTLESFEPWEPENIQTPIGAVIAYDSAALEVDADNNSLKLDKTGRLISLTTSGDIIVVKNAKGETKPIFPKLRQGLEADEMVNVPIKLRFYENTVIIDDSLEAVEYKTNDYKFNIINDCKIKRKSCGGDGGGRGCSGCSESNC